MPEPEIEDGRGDEMSDGPPPRMGFGRRLLLVTAALFLALFAAGSGTLWMHQWWLDRPVNRALEASGDAVDQLLARLADAKTLADVSAAGATAPESVESVGRALEAIRGENSHLVRDARSVITAQLALAEAIAPMQDLAEDSLMVWGRALPEMEEAEAALAKGTQALARLDKDAAAQVPDPEAATARAAEVVGDTAATILTTELTKLVDGLAKVSTTEQAAALGVQAAVLEEAADAATEGQDEKTATVLGHLSTGLGAIASLEDMDPMSLYLWDRNEPYLVHASERVGIDATASAASMTRWVTSAQREVDAWQEEYDAAEAQRAAVTTSLDSYSQAMEVILRGYDRARDRVSSVLENADLDEEYYIDWEVTTAMENGLATRERLLAKAGGLVPPAGMEASHQSVVDVLQAAVSAMEAGEKAVRRFNNCYFECTPLLASANWQEFSSASGAITGSFDTAREAWDAALQAALQQANAEPLPAMPDV